MSRPDDLIALAESMFHAEHGAPKAWFRVPQANGEPLNVIYVTYVARGATVEELNQWMEWHVLRPLKDKGGVWLYWRLGGCIEVDNSTGEMITMRTRIAVLDKDLQQLILPDEVVAEGKRIPTLPKGIVDVSAEG